jgi:signal transduction histidine kinase
MLATYSVASHLPTRRAVPAAAAVVTAVCVLILVEVDVGSSVLMLIWLGLPWFTGRHVRSYRRRAEQLRILTHRLERDRETRERLAVLEERARVARDLHDSLAHAVTIMVLQAGAAEAVMIQSPERAHEAIRAIESHGYQANDDLRHLLGILEADEAGPRAPQPSLSRLEPLMARARAAGLAVTTQVTGHPVRLEPALDVSAYRIVQEALTNALKHAGPVPTKVRLDYGPDALRIEVHNVAATRQPRPDNPGGHGLLGMRERAALYGGALEAGPCVNGGYLVRARLPLDPSVA